MAVNKKKESVNLTFTTDSRRRRKHNQSAPMTQPNENSYSATAVSGESLARNDEVIAAYVPCVIGLEYFCSFVSS